jgi:hypothetical protein
MGCCCFTLLAALVGRFAAMSSGHAWDIGTAWAVPLQNCFEQKLVSVTSMFAVA